MRKKRSFLLQGWKNDIPSDITRKLLVDDSPQQTTNLKLTSKPLSTESASFRPKTITPPSEVKKPRIVESLLESIGSVENNEGNLQRFLDVSTPVIIQ